MGLGQGSVGIDVDTREGKDEKERRRWWQGTYG